MPKALPSEKVNVMNVFLFEKLRPLLPIGSSYKREVVSAFSEI